MAKLSHKEGIATAAGFLALAVFLPAFFSQHTTRVDTERAFQNSQVAPERSSVLEAAILDLDVNDIVEGEGPRASFGDAVYVHYIGQLENGVFFDNSTKNEQPLVVRLGAGQVITGWELGLDGMREGGTRRLTIPPELAYGEQEIRDADGAVIIPSDATLVFDVVLLKVEKL